MAEEDRVASSFDPCLALSGFTVRPAKWDSVHDKLAARRPTPPL